MLSCFCRYCLCVRPSVVLRDINRFTSIPELEYNEDMQAWDGGELQGTCALLVECADDLEEILEQSSMYLGDNVTLIAGNSYEGGNDIGEAIIENAVVLAIV